MARVPKLHSFCLVALLVLAGAAGTRAAATPSGLFWDRYLALDRLLEASADSALAAAQTILREDSASFAARWARGAAAAGRDSAQVRLLLARAAAEPGDAGLQVEAGTAAFAMRHNDEGRNAFLRARDAYRAAGRLADASRSVLFLVLKDRSRDAHRARGESDLLEADSLARASGDPAAIADVRIVRGTTAVRRGPHESLPLFRQALELLEPFGTSVQLARCHRYIANDLKSQGDFDGARRHYAAARDQAAALGDSALVVQSLLGLGTVQKAEGDLDGAVVTAGEAMRMAQRLGRDDLVASAYDDRGNARLALGRYRDAREDVDSCLAIQDRAGVAIDARVATLDRLGGIEALLGNFDAARSRFESALAFARSRDLRARSVFVLLHLAALETNLGDPSRARTLAREGIEIARESSQPRVEIQFLRLQSDILVELGDDEEALAAAQDGLRLARSVEPRTQWSMYLSVARALEHLGRTKQALAMTDSAVALLPQFPDTTSYERALTIRGRLYSRRGESAAALASFDQALALARAADSPEREALIQVEYGPALMDAGRPREAVAVLEAGLRWFEGVTGAVRASEERIGHGARYQDAYLALAWAYARSGQPRRAFETMERSRARELRRLFGARTPGIARRVSPDLANQAARVESRLTAVQSEVLREYAKAPSQRRRGLRLLEAQSDSLKTLWSEIERRIEREAPAYARAADLTPPMSARKAGSALSAGQRLVAFMVGRDGPSLVFDLQPGSVAVHRVAWRLEDLAKRVGALNEAIQRDDRPTWSARSTGLADTLLGPLRLAERPPKTLYVLPDGPLYGLPFEALLVPATSGGPRQTLLELCEVTYANSATLLLSGAAGHANRTRSRGGTLVAFGDPAVRDSARSGARHDDRSGLAGIGPLPFARREAEALGSMYPEARVFVGNEATEERFFQEAPRASILHVAAHAFVDDRHPRFSGIVLAAARGSREDGVVQAFEILDHRFDLELATLSACETGKGRVLQGEGLLGLARAFHLAGARNLIVSLWKVDDAATEPFMREFYQRLRRGEAPASAIRGAKLALMRRDVESMGTGRGEPPGAQSDGTRATTFRGVGTYTHAQRLARPSTWAAFVLLGTRSE